MQIKRYWLLVVLIPFCLLAIGTYYVSGAGDQKPDYLLQTINGQDSEGASLQVEAQINAKPLWISTQGSEYESDKMSYVESLDSTMYRQEQLKILVKENRSFMRGKNAVSSFYNDDKVLAYVGSDSPSYSQYPAKGQSNLLKISVKWKLEKVVTSFEIQSDKRNDEIIRIYDVQVKDGIMKVLANRQQVGNDYGIQFKDARYQMYTIDLEKKSLMSSEPILPANKQESENLISTNYMWATDLIGSNGYAIFHQSETKKIDKAGNQAEQRYEGLVKREILIYDLWNGKWETVQNDALYSSLMEDQEMGVSIQHTNEELTLTSLSQKLDSRVIRIDLAANKVISDVKLSLQAIQKEWGRINANLLEKNRLHILMFDGRRNPAVAIVDLQTGNVIYQAEVRRKDADRLGNISVYGLHIKE
ncbi:hypothetical protein LJR153_001639 [Paenibacillus sp. LjRoot153]|uniref:hypothetical protein n=1 Tax=Paenibacillus sp. LjRoot153 TaxID=3342270 RepID=UPI003ECCE86B